ncbi:MAG: class II fructose-bisphosphate aldolase [Candidatus Scalinduaceae bacterium]
MMFKEVTEIRDYVKDTLEILLGGKVNIINESLYRNEKLDRLVHNAVFNEKRDLKGISRWLIRQSGCALGIISASIQGLYERMGRSEYTGFTVPAINIRGLTYDVARSIIRAAKKNDVGAFIFEIAKSEIGYTEQRPSEYTAVVLAAAIREGYQGPIFIQGDHFQVNAKKYAKDPESEFNTVRDLIKEALEADFYNIDIDTSTLVDLNKQDIVEQQRLNFELAAQFTSYIRENQPDGVMVSVGGEIGEVGGKNSTEEELRVFMDNYLKTISDKKGISKISIQTGTTHGGVPLPDGSIAKVKLDFDTLQRLSKVARDEYGLSGAVQHGASTLPGDAFDKFPKTGTAEVHLATEFQNMIYENEQFPKELREEIYDYLKKNCADERKEGQTDEQFIYKTRKKAFGPFKEKIWDLPSSVKENIGSILEKKFVFLFEKLNVVNTKKIIDETIKPIEIMQSPPLSID